MLRLYRTGEKHTSQGDVFREVGTEPQTGKFGLPKGRYYMGLTKIIWVDGEPRGENGGILSGYMQRRIEQQEGQPSYVGQLYTVTPAFRDNEGTWDGEANCPVIEPYVVDD
jgi:hypothetical protein